MNGDVSTVQVRIEGMGCRRCIREVTARLRDIAGVQTISADAASSVVKLTGCIATAEIVEALAGTEYSVAASRRSDSSHNELRT